MKKYGGGLITQMNRKKSWYKITEKYNAIKYKQGSWDIDEGLDCISMIVLFMKDIGKSVDDWITGSKAFEYKGNHLTATTFLDYLSDKNEITKALKSFLKYTCKKVDRMSKGDIVFFNYRKDILFGIYLGGGLVMCSFETYGIKKIKLRNFDIMEIYRWV